jgi:hypothetical protein
MIIGICGWIGSGKDTVAEYLVNKHGFVRESYAGTLKDAVANVFGWNREWLEGLTPESREWREQVDPWWSERLNIPHLTPRWVLQQWGTDVCRKAFHNDIWIASLESKLRDKKDNIVISDCRFPNEIKSIKKQGGVVIWVKRGELPEWYHTALRENTTDEDDLWMLQDAEELMEQKYPNIHPSEWAWVGPVKFNAIFDNNGSLEDLYKQVDELITEYEPVDFVRRIALDEI